MAFLDILIYVLFAAIMCCLAKKSYINYSQTTQNDKFLIAYILFYTIICAIRWNVGTDSIAYAVGFEFGPNRSEINGEYIFYYLQYILSKYGFHFSIGLGICAFFQIFFITKALLPYKYILVTLPIILFGNKYFLDLNNGVRQMIVASLFVYCSRYIVEKKLLKYLIFLFVASMIHHSALMLIPFYLIPDKWSIANKRILMFIIFIICFIAGQTPSFQNFVGYAETLSSVFGYEGYTERVGSLLTSGITEETLSFGPMMLSYFLIAVATIWFGPDLKKHYEHTIPYFNLWYLFSFFYVCAYFLICNISHIFIRPIQYFELFHLIIASLLLFEIGFGRFKKRAIAVMFTLIVWTNTSWDIIKAHNSKDEWESSTYKTIFFHQEQINKIFMIRKK